jgi:hypothetical protein
MGGSSENHSRIETTAGRDPDGDLRELLRPPPHHIGLEFAVLPRHLAGQHHEQFDATVLSLVERVPQCLLGRCDAVQADQDGADRSGRPFRIS